MLPAPVFILSLPLAAFWITVVQQQALGVAHQIPLPRKKNRRPVFPVFIFRAKLIYLLPEAAIRLLLIREPNIDNASAVVNIYLQNATALLCLSPVLVLAETGKITRRLSQLASRNHRSEGAVINYNFVQKKIVQLSEIYGID